MTNLKKTQPVINRSHSPSIKQKFIFSFLHFIILFFSAWLIYFDGLALIGALLSIDVNLADPSRANIMFMCVVLYWIRQTFTLFYLLSRRVEWSEVFGLVSIFMVFEIGFILLGGGIFRKESIALNFLDVFALFFLLSGSFLNTFSELQRKWWKNNPENSGHCYTGGLFRYSMHINYFGDTILFTGWVLFSQNVFALGLPVIMAISFMFFHIPNLDKYLLERYGDEFKKYSLKTKRFIPFIY